MEENLVMVMFPIYKPSLVGNEKKYVNECLDSSWISSRGSFVGRFEKCFADFINVEANCVITTSSDTIALHLAMEALKIGVNEEIISTHKNLNSKPV